MKYICTYYSQRVSRNPDYYPLLSLIIHIYQEHSQLLFAMRVLESSLLSFIIFNYQFMSRTFIIIIRDACLGILIIILYYL